MLTFTALGPSSVRITNGSAAVTAYADKPAQSGDMLIHSVPEEVPAPQVICWPGEYDVGGVTLRGIGHDEGRQTSFLVVMDGIRCALPSTPIKEWSDAELQQMGDVDVVVVPSAEPKILQSLVDELDPRALVILSADDNAELLRALGAQDKEPVTEYKLKSLPQEGREVVVLTK